MGRDKRNEQRTEHWTKMVRPMMQTDAWRSLSPTAQALYPWIKFEWHGPKANNNGKIRLSVRQAAQCIGCNPKTAGRAFHDLQAKGFLVQVEGACLGTGGDAQSPSYEITELPMPPNDRPRQLYSAWRNGHDFPVIVSGANNPNGNNGRGPRADNVVPLKGLHS